MCRQMSILFKREWERNILQQNSDFVLNKKNLKIHCFPNIKQFIEHFSEY